VDDEPDVVSTIESILRAEGYGVLSAYDGIAAVDIAESERPGLVLLDIMMPMMSGYEVCEQLKANPVTQQIPVVCLTSAHTPDAFARSHRAGAITVLPKPFLPAELVAQVERYLHHKPVAEGAAPTDETGENTAGA
jgi:CheY-like chemotaxis protein